MRIQKIVNLAIVIALGLGLNGCAIKQTDSTGTKALKHTVNAPAYVVIGSGALATGVFNGIGRLIFDAPAASIKEAMQNNNSNEAIQSTEDEIKQN